MTTTTADPSRTRARVAARAATKQGPGLEPTDRPPTASATSGRRPRRRSSGWVGSVLLLALVLPLVGAWLGGWRFEHVQTASMEPTYPRGSLVVTRPIAASEVQQGDVITFLDPADRNRTVTHRVVEVAHDPDEGLQLRTQGDANASPDPQPVPPANVQREARWAVPHLGGWIEAAKGPWAVALVLGGAVLLLVTGEVRDRRRRGAGDASPSTVDGPVVALDAACTTCAARIAGRDRYCRDCGARQPDPLRPRGPARANR